VTKALAIRILSGRYPQGTLLPTEVQLGAELGVSRTALREATRTLAAKGLIESRQRAGTRVRASEDWNRLDPDMLSWMAAIEPDLDFVNGLTEARKIIEPAVAPTFITTPGTDDFLADPAHRADVVERIAALHRIGAPMEVAGAVVFLASPAASLITGETLIIDGGWTAR
jgi:hypothetical protein